MIRLAITAAVLLIAAIIMGIIVYRMFFGEEIITGPTISQGGAPPCTHTTPTSQKVRLAASQWRSSRAASCASAANRSSWRASERCPRAAALLLPSRPLAPEAPAASCSASARLDVDPTANREANRQLADRRADVVAQELIRLGVSGRKIYAGAALDLGATPVAGGVAAVDATEIYIDY